MVRLSVTWFVVAVFAMRLQWQDADKQAAQAAGRQVEKPSIMITPSTCQQNNWAANGLHLKKGSRHISDSQRGSQQ
jgi:hypothetical protein